MSPKLRLGGGLALGGGTVLAALFGLFFQSLLAYHFGAGAETDAWFMSLSVFAFLGKLLMLSHLKSIALPAYRRLRGYDPGEARRFVRLLLAWTTGIGALLSALLVGGAPLLVDAVAPGYEGSVRDLTVTLVRIRTPALVFLALTAGALVATEAAGRFGATVVAQKVAPAAVALVLLAVAGDRWGMVGVGWIGLAGGVAGGALALAMVWPPLRNRPPGAGGGATEGGGARPRDGARASEELRSVGGRWIRFGGSNGATFVGEWAFRVAASLLPVGLFSAVLYGRMVHDLLHGALNDPAQTVGLPRFAAAMEDAGGDVWGGPLAPVGEDGTARLGAAGGDGPLARLGEELRRSLVALGSVTVPVAAFVAASATWLVALLFGRGRFLADGMVEPAATSLRIFAAGFLVQGMNQVIFAGAFAAGRAHLVNRVQIAGHLVRAAALVPATLAFSFVGLVSAQVGMNLLVLLLLLGSSPPEWGLRRRSLRALATGAGRGVAIATALALALHLSLARLLPDPLAVGTAARLFAIGALAVLWLAAYGVVAWWLGVGPARVLARLLRRSSGNI